MNTATQIAKCQEPGSYTGRSSDYVAAQEYADARHKLGHRQQFCQTCQLWKYKDAWTDGRLSHDNDVLCSIAVAVPLGKCIRCEKTRPAKDESMCRKCIRILEAAAEETP